MLMANAAAAYNEFGPLSVKEHGQTVYYRYNLSIQETEDINTARDNTNFCGTDGNGHNYGILVEDVRGEIQDQDGAVIYGQKNNNTYSSDSVWYLDGRTESGL